MANGCGAFLISLVTTSRLSSCDGVQMVGESTYFWVRSAHFLQGKMIAIGYSDGSTRIYDVNNGKPIHKLISEAADFDAVTCVSWVDNHSHSVNTNVAPEAKSTECTPQALFDLDISSMLPRLSVLPSSSGP